MYEEDQKCPHENMNGDWWHPLSGEKHAMCLNCGFVADEGTQVFDFNCDHNWCIDTMWEQKCVVCGKLRDYPA